MYFLHTETLKLIRIDNLGRDIASKYAILSHTWGDEEVLFSDLQGSPYSEEIENLQDRIALLESYFLEGKAKSSFQEGQYSWSQEAGEGSGGQERAETEKERNRRLRGAKRKKGWSKIEACCREATKYGVCLVWIDTCCIDKDSSAELSEAINSMFEWYRNAKVCLVYLEDVFVDDDRDRGQLRKARWFTRGWTLQELIAPPVVIFFSKDWAFIGTGSSLAQDIAEITGIDQAVLGGDGTNALSMFSVANRLSWAAKRSVTRPEDRPYSLMGLFGVNMPIIYGEGERAAFFRLQQEIFQVTGDHSIFAWAFWSQNWNSAKKRIIHHTAPPAALEKDLTESEFEVLRMRGDVLDHVANLFALSLDHFRDVPRIESAPYNALGSNFPNLSRIRTVSRYSAAPNGIRAQLLLKSIQNTPRRIIFRAYPACRFKASNNSGLICIYLVFKRPGQYLRLDPKQLLLIEDQKLNPYALTLEELYVSNILPEIKYRSLPSKFGQLWMRRIRLKLLDDEFPASCYTVRSSSEITWHPEEGHADINMPFSAMTREVHFRHFSTEEAFTIGVRRDSVDGFCASIWTSSHEDSKKGPIVTVVVGKPLGSGRHVFVSFSHESKFHDRGIVMVVVKGKSGPESEPP